MSTLVVPYTIGSQLKKEMHAAKDSFVNLVGGSKVRVVESGGNVLAHLIVPCDPWAANRYCDDPGFLPCKSRAWAETGKESCKEGWQGAP